MTTKQPTLLMLVFMVLTLFSITATAQHRNCGATEYLEYQKQNDPKRAEKLRQIEQHTRNFLQNPNQRAVNGVITIPVVVHVVYNSSTENISAAQVQSQLDVLNEDFRRTNSDADGTWPQAADSEIEFCLATVDPNGNSTNGITRTSTSQTSFGTNDQVKFNSSGGKDAWPAADYLNVWVCDIGGGILGYAQFPGGNPSTDGVVNDYRYFGNTGTAQAPFDLGRTMTHEVGHYLNLRHIWGDGGCSVDDFVSDTPVSDASNGGCATSHVSCGTVDMVQNYMDYSDDACMNLFTTGQRNRMRAIFDTGGARASLLASGACGNPPTGPTCSDGIQNQGETGIDCGGPCTPCAVACTNNEATLSITFDNYPEETSWTLTTDGGVTIASGGTYGSSPDGSTFTEDFCLTDGCYTFTINDAYGDGICCSYGNGNYALNDASGNLASGGSFTTSESTNFCLGGGPAPTCNDGIQNQGETGIDCGGPCTACETCDDGIQNQGETGVDCGGPCTACETCNDGIQNQGETGVDCGGPCAPCTTGCSLNEASLEIIFDNYPEETSWTLTTDAGTTIASGGTYGSSPDGSTFTEDFCLTDGCYTFTINDTYGDGICCSVGNGSYSLINFDGKLAAGGSFTSSESTNFCLGNGPAPSCNDGIQNQGETGVDCGGPCTPCTTGCTDVTLDDENFEGGWGIWNDGGSDAYRNNSTTYANSGSFSIRLRDNTSSSVMTTDNLNLAGFEETTVEFSYVGRSMENGEDFWLQVSTNGGSSYQTVASWARGTDFQNGVREYDLVTITGTFSATTRFRFRCDASGNSDYVYIDDVVLSGCANGNTRQIGADQLAQSSVEVISNMQVFPNPVSESLNVGFTVNEPGAIELAIIDFSGKKVVSQSFNAMAGAQISTIDVTDFPAGFYLVNLITKDKVVSKKVVVTRTK